MKFNSILGSVSLFLFFGCKSPSGSEAQVLAQKTEMNDTKAVAHESTNAEILAKREVPVICYHQIRPWRPSDGKRAMDDIIAPDKFEAHIKMLADSGYTSILPDDLYAHLTQGKALPAKPVMITFDDTDLDQYTVGAPVLRKYGFKGVFFIMTVSIGKKGRIAYMNKAQIKELSDEGHAIGSHTYDHKSFAKFTEEDWETQIEKPNKTLEAITGKKVSTFAYPYGIYKKENLERLKSYGFKTAFILSTARDEAYPLLTLRRIVDPGHYTAQNLYNSMQKSFNKVPKM